MAQISTNDGVTTLQCRVFNESITIERRTTGDKLVLIYYDGEEEKGSVYLDGSNIVALAESILALA